MALTNARVKAMVDTELALPAHDFIAYSTNGTSESADCPRRPVTFSTPTAADPYEPSNTTDVTCSPTHTTGTQTITHWATAASGTNGAADLGTIWIPVTDPDPIVTVGGSFTAAAGSLRPVRADRITVS